MFITCRRGIGDLHYLILEDSQALATLLIDIINIVWSMAATSLLVLRFVYSQLRKWRTHSGCNEDALHGVTRNSPLAILLSNPTRKTLSVINYHRRIRSSVSN